VEEFVQRVLMFLVGLVFLGGGTIFTFQAFEDAKNVFETLIFSLMGAAVGLTLIVWTFTGPPG
jgi:hypothetical protein